MNAAAKKTASPQDKKRIAEILHKVFEPILARYRTDSDCGDIMSEMRNPDSYLYQPQNEQEARKHHARMERKRAAILAQATRLYPGRLDE